MNSFHRTVKTVSSLAVYTGLGVALFSLPAMAKLAASPASLSFGNVRVGNTKALYASVKNNGSSKLEITKATLNGTAFSLSGLSAPLTLTAGQSYTFAVKFVPKGSGNKTGKLTLAAGTVNVAIPLYGVATPMGRLSLSPAQVSFGSVKVGSTKKVTTTLTASVASVVISSAGTTSGEFILSGASLPLTLSAGKSATFTITFKPQSSGSAWGKTKFVSNALQSQLTQSLTGAGTAVNPPSPHSVSLTWKASSSSVAGYNIYRGTVSGGPFTRLNSTLDTATSYRDESVSAGKTYYYVATSVASNGSEGPYSGQIKAVIPNP